MSAAEYRQRYKALGLPKWWQIKSRYGLSREQYEQLLEEQAGICPACGEAVGDRTIAVDHDHATKVVRGIIHRQCNSMIGLAKERADILECAAAYLRKHEVKQ